MAADNLTQGVKKFQALEQQVRAYDGSDFKSQGAKEAREKLQTEVSVINEQYKNDSAGLRRFMAELTKDDENGIGTPDHKKHYPVVQIGTDTDASRQALWIYPWQVVTTGERHAQDNVRKHLSLAAPWTTEKETGLASRESGEGSQLSAARAAQLALEIQEAQRRETSDRTYDSLMFEANPNNPVILSIKTERGLLTRDGNNQECLFDRMYKETHSNQDPNNKDAELKVDDIAKFRAVHANNLSPEDTNTLDTLIQNWGPIANNIGGSFSGDFYISKQSMGVNLARRMGEALLGDGLFDRVPKSFDRNKLKALDIQTYLDTANNLPPRERSILQEMDVRLEGMRSTGRPPNLDWALGLIGHVGEDKELFFTKQSIATGILQYGLASYTGQQ